MIGFIRLLAHVILVSVTVMRPVVQIVLINNLQGFSKFSLKPIDRLMRTRLLVAIRTTHLLFPTVIIWAGPVLFTCSASDVYEILLLVNEF